MRTQSRIVPAPADLEAGLVGVREGAELELDFRLESVVDGVLVSGTVRAPLSGECARCLEPLADSVDAEFQELFVYPADDLSAAEDADEDETHRLEGDLIDLEPVVRDAVVLELPLSPLCRDDCPGLCAQCGVRLADAPPDHGHDGADPRWAALRKLTNHDNETQEG
ncbi:YceD family protein [Allonocardiopsis opalescens]|uniref:DUF177 domain-containing protein n=1 Tax=Allonocardiopsis opalescens TaxID=1144618 RepID=A0A2T0PWA4_9ACTN|nr:DUF177 domain-containing protein [Allonocardiopsis opalescens]PRX95638.1 uncharacterized protein CLV72_109247 [Allonocardiopsis opalescens]